MEIYGNRGTLMAPQKDLLRAHPLDGKESEMSLAGAPLSNPDHDQLSYLAAVVRGEIQPSGLSSVDVNMTVTEILDAARDSARTGKLIHLPAKAP
jgi:predicted dehydrogenase